MDAASGKREELRIASRAVARNGRRAGQVGDIVGAREEPSGRVSVVLAFPDGDAIRYDERDVDPIVESVRRGFERFEPDERDSVTRLKDERRLADVDADRVDL